MGVGQEQTRPLATVILVLNILVSSGVVNLGM